MCHCFQILPVHGHQFVAHVQSAVHMSGAIFQNFGHVNAVVAGNVLIAQSAGDAEPQSLIAANQFDVDDVAPVRGQVPTHWRNGRQS